jgi:tRNA(fMet)-specific endonuclease VapC
MIRFMLDTNVVRDLVREPHGQIASRVLRHGEERVGISIVTAAELHHGIVKRGSTDLARRVGAILRQLPTLPLESPADRFYGELRADLERKGRKIGGNDMLIAAHALALGCTIVTANVAEFSRVKGLRVEDWSKGKA